MIYFLFFFLFSSDELTMKADQLKSLLKLKRITATLYTYEMGITMNKSIVIAGRYENENDFYIKK